MHPFNRLPAESFIEMQQAFNDWWNKAEELADETRKDNVHRSSLQWRWFLARLDQSLQADFIQEVKDYGIFWSEDNQSNPRW